MTMAERKSNIILKKDIPYLTHTGELLSVFCEEFGENWLPKNSTALYTVVSSDMRLNSTVPVTWKYVHWSYKATSGTKLFSFSLQIDDLRPPMSCRSWGVLPVASQLQLRIWSL